jgi:hypothetical protein
VSFYLRNTSSGFYFAGRLRLFNHKPAFFSDEIRVSQIVPELILVVMKDACQIDFEDTSIGFLAGRGYNSRSNSCSSLTRLRAPKFCRRFGYCFRAARQTLAGILGENASVIVGSLCSESFDTHSSHFVSAWGLAGFTLKSPLG